MNFANVTDIRIPQGEVIRIQDSTSRVLWEKYSPTPYSTPFYIENTTNQAHTINIELTRESSTDHPTGRFTFSYATNIGSWTDVTLTYSWDGSGNKKWSQTIPANSRIYFASSEGRWYWLDSMYSLWMRVGFGSDDNTGSFKLGGNSMSLIYGTSFTGDEVILPKRDAFNSLFSGFGLLIDASELLLPATTLTNSCYSDMFYDCSSLTKAPELPAPTLLNGCYSNMFKYCDNLSYIRCLATDISVRMGRWYWLDGVSPTGTFYKKAGVEWPSGVSGIPEGWTVVEV